MSWLSDRTGIHVNSINDITSGRALKEAAKNPLVDAGLALAIPGVGGAIAKGVSSIPGVSGIASGIGNAASGINGLLTKIPGVQGLESALTGSGSGSGGGVTGLLDFLGNHKDLLLGGAQALNAANLQQKAGNYANQAVQSATEPWNQKAPLRQAGVTAMLNAAQYNPYSKAPGSVPPNAVNRVTPIPATSWS